MTFPIHRDHSCLQPKRYFGVVLVFVCAVFHVPCWFFKGLFHGVSFLVLWLHASHPQFNILVQFGHLGGEVQNCLIQDGNVEMGGG